MQSEENTRNFLCQNLRSEIFTMNYLTKFHYTFIQGLFFFKGKLKLSHETASFQYHLTMKDTYIIYNSTFKTLCWKTLLSRLYHSQSSLSFRTHSVSQSRVLCHIRLCLPGFVRFSIYRPSLPSQPF